MVEPRQSGWVGWPDPGRGAADRGVGGELPCGYGYGGCWPSGEQAGVERVAPPTGYAKHHAPKFPKDPLPFLHSDPLASKGHLQ